RRPPRRGFLRRHARCTAAGGDRREDEGLQGRQARGERHAPDREGLQRRRDRGARGLFLAAAALGARGGHMQRRDFLKAGTAISMAALAGCAAAPGAAAKARVVVVGGGFGGATAARYVRRLDPAIDVTLVEAEESFVSHPLSNMVLGGFKTVRDITV